MGAVDHIVYEILHDGGLTGVEQQVITEAVIKLRTSYQGRDQCYRTGDLAGIQIFNAVIEEQIEALKMIELLLHLADFRANVLRAIGIEELDRQLDATP